MTRRSPSDPRSVRPLAAPRPALRRPGGRLVPALAAAIAILLVAPLAPSAAPASTARVLIVSIDGLRPDVLLRADAPNLRGLMARGAFTMWAHTTAVAITLPSHTSMLTGVTPATHGVTWNDDRYAGQPVYPKVPTLFELAHRAGMTTAMAAGKAKFSLFEKPGTLDWSFVPPKGRTTRDSVVTDRAVAMITGHRPRVMFVHLPDCDLTGHDHGWGSPEQVAVASNADRCVGRLLAALAREGVLDSTVVIVSADHGGANHTHGGPDVRSQSIPWIAAGPGIRHDVDLTSETKDDVHTEDTFATACQVLGLALPPGTDGRPVERAFHAMMSTR